MRYLATICVAVDPDLGPEEDAALQEAVRDWVHRYDRLGVRVMGAPLGPVADAYTVKVREGSRLVTEGPFAESREVMAGFDLLECDTIEQAIEVAAAHPIARFAEIEVWPLVDMDWHAEP